MSHVIPSQLHKSGGIPHGQSQTTDSRSGESTGQIGGREIRPVFRHLKTGWGVELRFSAVARRQWLS